MAKRRSRSHEPADGGDERPTHAERRRHGSRSAELARQLLTLPDADVDEMVLPESIREELEEARRIRSPGALRRQERRIAQVLRDEELDLVARAIAEQKEKRAHEARRFQRVETWRERLLTGDEALDELRAAAPDISAKELAVLVENARRERDTGRPKGASRALFRRLREWLEPDQ